VTSGAYIYTYTVAGVLWYVGKGSGTRAGRHLRRAKRHAKGLPMHRIAKWQIELAGALAAGEQIDIRILAEGMTCAEAFALEIRMIAELRPLKNILAGGNGNIKRLTS
jgi:hypothetical protein